MLRTKIEGSSNIAEIGYDYDNRTLEIKFHGGRIYQYWPITRYGWESLMMAESKGSHFAKHIRGNPKIQFQEVDEMQADG